MSLYSSNTYTDDLENAIASTLSLDKLKGKSIMITGATGLIGSFITDMLIKANQTDGLDLTIYALSRSVDRLEKRFGKALSEKLKYIAHDINEEISFDIDADYIIHAASNAYPALFNADPVGTIVSNVLGTYRLLEYGKSHKTKRFLFVSSGEVYGQGDLSLDSFDESYGGYVDPVNPRSCYPSAKRTAETLCTSYTKQFGLDTVIVRPCHTYGPSATAGDNRANVQFVNNALEGQDIVLKSAGRQMRSYCYVADCASAVLSVLLCGKSGEAYNIANSEARITIAGFAETVAEKTGRKVIFEVPDLTALAEQTPIEKQVLSSEKLVELGWTGKYTVNLGVEHTIKALKEI